MVVSLAFSIYAKVKHLVSVSLITIGGGSVMVVLPYLFGLVEDFGNYLWNLGNSEHEADHNHEVTHVKQVVTLSCAKGALHHIEESTNLIKLNTQSIDHKIIAAQVGGWIVLGGGPQHITLNEGSDTIVISLCKSRVSNNCEVSFIKNFSSEDRIVIGCSLGAVLHKDIQSEYRANEDATYVYIYDTNVPSHLRGTPGTLRFAFALEGVVSGINDHILTVEDKSELFERAEAVEPNLACLPNMFFGELADWAKRSSCKDFDDHPCCLGVNHEIH
jgi:hypothetical protein